MTNTADTSGADAAAPEAPTFAKGQLVSFTWDDPFDGDGQVVYGLVVELPSTEEGADETYAVAWLPKDLSHIAPADLAAV